MSNTRTIRPKPATGVGAPQPVHLDLDGADRPEPQREAFTVQLGGRVLSFADPNDLDWQDAMASMEDPVVMLRIGLSADDFEYLMGAHLATWKLQRLFGAWGSHYGMDVRPDTSS